MDFFRGVDKADGVAEEDEDDDDDDIIFTTLRCALRDAHRAFATHTRVERCIDDARDAMPPFAMGRLAIERAPESDASNSSSSITIEHMASSSTCARDIARALDALERDVRRAREMRVEDGFRAHARRPEGFEAIDEDIDDDGVALMKFTAAVRARARATRTQILDARSAWFEDGARGKAQALERCTALEELIEPTPTRTRTRANDAASTSTTAAAAAWGGDFFGAITNAVRKLTVARDDAAREGDVGAVKPRYTRAQREREATSTSSARRSDEIRANDDDDDDDGSARGGLVGKATWYAGAAESLARVGAGVAATKTSTSADERFSADAERHALFHNASSKTSSSMSTSTAEMTTAALESAASETKTRASSSSSSNAEERARRVAALTATSRLDASSDTLAQCKSTLENVHDVGADVLATLASQRESLVRAGAAARRAQRDMDDNLKTIKGMNSWTRLGCKP